MIKCVKCGADKEYTEFWKANNKLGHEVTCKSCRMLLRYEQERAKSRARGAKSRVSTLMARELRLSGLKLCPGCNTSKPVDEFYSSGNSNGGVASHCILCANELCRARPKEERQQRYQRDRTKFRAYRLKQKFGISVEEYDRLLSEQGGVCAICGGTDNNKRLAVDHCHKTNIVRALLCGRCNPAVGFLLEDVSLATKVLAYIEKHQRKE